MKITVGWWKALDGSKWHVDWVGKKNCIGHDESELPMSWHLDGSYMHAGNTGLDLIAPWTEPKLRPWKPEEVPLGARVNDKRDDKSTQSIIIHTSNEGLRISFGTLYSFQMAMEHLQYSIDNGITWFPCGVVEDVK